jgi:hypothetical protein
MRAQTSHPVAGATAFAFAIALLIAAMSAPAMAKSGPPPEPLYWDMRPVYRLEHLVGKTMSVVSFSSPFAECDGPQCSFINFPTTPLNNVRNHGAIPFFGWNSSAAPETADQRPFRLAKINDGSFDPFIRRFAEAAKLWKHPFFLRFDWEMNGFWFPWSEGLNGNKPGEFVAAWRHVHDIFTSVGATNATWVWCPNVDFTRKLIPLHTVYPGDAYVDWTCLDGFNWGRHSDSAGWQTFGRVFHETYRRVLRIAPDKPMIIGEVASNKIGGSKADWIRNMLHVVPSRYRKIRGLIWFDVNDRNTNWPLERQPKSVEAFARGIAHPAFFSNIFGAIGSSPIPPPSWP